LYLIAESVFLQTLKFLLDSQVVFISVLKQGQHDLVESIQISHTKCVNAVMNRHDRCWQKIKAEELDNNDDDK